MTGHIRNLRESGNEPFVNKIKDCLTEEEAFILEEQEILKYGRKGYEDGGILLNIYIANRPEQLFGQNNSFYGKKHSEESKKMISESNKGKRFHRNIVKK